MGVACILIQAFARTKDSRSTKFAKQTAQVNGFSNTGESYPYLFVFPLYRFLKIRNLPDITRLFLLQLSDFLKNTNR